MARSIRLRIASLTALIFAVILVAAAYLFIVQLQSSLYASVSASAERDAEAIADRTPTPEDWDDDDRFFQVADNGTLVASSEDVVGLDAITDDRVTLDGDEYLVFRESDEGETVIVGHSLSDAKEAVGTVVGLLFVAVPVLVVIVFVLMLVVVGRALQPVERMRREVDAVTATNLDQRIVDPGSRDEIGRLATTMNRMLARLAESQATQRRFISDASHELKSPLASLRQFAEVSRDYPGRISEAELADAVLDESGRLERIVSNLLLLARADERSLQLSNAPVDVDDLLLAEASRLRGSTGIDVDSSGVSAVRATGDHGLLVQVVRNLVDNAARHASSRIRLGLTGAPGGAVLTVEDDGAGIPPSERERVFERFVRLDDARGRDAGGTGLGLAIVRELVVAHGGSVTVGDSPLGGASFTVTLP